MQIFDRIVRNLKVACVLPKFTLAWHPCLDSAQDRTGRIGPILSNFPALSSLRIALGALIRPILVGIFAAGCHAETPQPIEISQSPQADQIVPAGDKLVQAAASKLRQHVSIAANVRHHIDLFGQPLVGTGMYYQLQAGDRTLLSLSLKTQQDEHQTSFQQVFDGKTLWVRRHLSDRSELTFVNMDRVRRWLTDKDQRPPDPWSPDLNPGGLPAIVSRLLEKYRFDVPRSASLYGEKVWEVRGNWKLSHKESDKESSDVPVATGSILPDFVPKQVVLMIGCEDLFPYRWEYQDETSQPILTMLVYQVKIGQPLDPGQFAFRPANESEYKDVTDDYLRQIARRRDARVARVSRTR